MRMGLRQDPRNLLEFAQRGSAVCGVVCGLLINALKYPINFSFV